ncbi:MAG: hypothetical protein Q4F57_01695 [Weeksellaceae bacterium]|nr:hypothetical protein [Weeksellaceae bacterium]
MKILQDPVFKAAVKALPEKEKDKLLIRLLRFDEILTEKIYFEQVDHNTADHYRLQIEEKIPGMLKPKKGEYFYPYLLVKKMRKASGIINRHVRVTTDKFGEPWLNLLILTEIMEQYRPRFHFANAHTYQDFNKYFTARLFRTLRQIQALDEDYHLDFQDKLSDLASHIQQTPMLQEYVIESGLNPEQLAEGEIPADIKDLAEYAKTRKMI